MSYARVAQHSAMLFDRVRNAAYARAIRGCVNADSVVLDLGAGLGLHGMVAAAAGARRVYLVEPQPVVQVAAEIARANGLADRITIVQSRIEDAALPEPADLIVSVFTGNLLYSEDLLPALFHARDRCLKPGGRLLPDRAQLWVAPLHAPRLHQAHVQRWTQRMEGLDFSAGRSFAANEILWLAHSDFAGSRRLAPGQPIVDLDLRTATGGDCAGEVACVAHADGLCHGLLAWIRIALGDTWLSTAPEEAELHWRPVFLPLDPPLPLAEGEAVRIAIRRPQHGDWTWTAQAGSQRRQHSTFLANADGPRELRAMAPQAVVRPGRDGEIALRVLTLMREGMANATIAQQIAREHGMPAADALRRVQALALRYGMR